MLALVLLACLDDPLAWDSSDSGPAGDGRDTADCCYDCFPMQVDAEDDAVVVRILGCPDYAAWLFGMAESGAGAAGWYGESCIEGPEPHGMDDQGFDYCHQLVAGEALVLTLADPYAPENVVENETTLFTRAMLEQATFVIATVDETGPCYVWGDDNSYYSGYGCSAM